jgi:hypothetical protein
MNSIGKGISAIFAILLFAAFAAAHDGDDPRLQGRWEFAVTTGDSQSQLTSFGQTTFSTVLLQNDEALTNIVNFTTDTSECDTVAFDNVAASGTVDDRGHVTIAFTVGNGPGQTQTPFQFVFTGKFKRAEHDGDKDDKPETITGTYQKTAGGCTQGSLGTSTPDGNFVATHFPDLNGTFAGAFDDPTNGTNDLDVPAIFKLKTLADHSVSGTVSAPSLVNAGGVACFAGPVTLTTGQASGSFANGVQIELFGQDQNQTQLFVFAFDVNPDGTPAAVGEDNPKDGRNGTINDGTDKELDATYNITGGPCDGFAGNDETFKMIAKHHKHDSEAVQAHGNRRP